MQLAKYKIVKMDRKVIFDEAKFDAKYIKRSQSECWFWIASSGTSGYPQFGIKKNGKYTMGGGHRVSLYRKLGYDDTFWFSKLQAGHLCNNPSCVNPDHLEPQTSAEDAKWRIKSGSSGKGSKNGSAKLTEEQVLAIRAIEGKTRTQIAKEYGVAQTLISQIILRKIWTHI